MRQLIIRISGDHEDDVAADIQSLITGPMFEVLQCHFSRDGVTLELEKAGDILNVREV